jgi:hypothetical protein
MTNQHLVHSRTVRNLGVVSNHVDSSIATQAVTQFLQMPGVQVVVATEPNQWRHHHSVGMVVFPNSRPRQSASID